jgi:hypothetical protein
MFGLENIDYHQYNLEHQLNEVLGENIDENKNLDEKLIRPVYESVDPNNKTPFSTEYDDLIRLHYLVTSRKVTTILEFGVGKSTPIFNHALNNNKSLYHDYVTSELRRSNPFECFSIDNNQDWIDLTKNTFPNLDNVHFHCSELEMSTFNQQICTFYKQIPNICPDFIYLDAPDQFSSEGSIRGISTRHPDRMPMSADILGFENFLVPGTLIVVDGRAANARFLKNNLKRDWNYYYSEDFDQHFFELKEVPLGPYNKRQIQFCLGSDWLENF